jgi:hypothetical protein
MCDIGQITTKGGYSKDRQKREEALRKIIEALEE